MFSQVLFLPPCFLLVAFYPNGSFTRLSFQVLVLGTLPDGLLGTDIGFFTDCLFGSDSRYFIGLFIRYVLALVL